MICHLVSILVRREKGKRSVVVRVVIVTPALIALQLEARILERTCRTVCNKHIGHVAFITTGRLGAANVSHPIVFTTHSTDDEHLADVLLRPAALQNMLVGSHEEEGLEGRGRFGVVVVNFCFVTYPFLCFVFIISRNATYRHHSISILSFSGTVVKVSVIWIVTGFYTETILQVCLEFK